MTTPTNPPPRLPGAAAGARRPRGPGRWVLVGLLLLPVLELYVLIQVGQLIGAWATVGLVVLGVLVGVRIVTWKGRTAFTALRERLDAGAAPDGRHAGDAALVMLGGLFLVFPGFVTDVLGLLLLAPPTRSLARRLAGRAARGRVARVTVQGVTVQGVRPQRPDVVRGEVVDGEIVDEAGPLP